MTKDERVQKLVDSHASGASLRAVLEMAYDAGREAGCESAPRVPPGVSTWNVVHPTDRTDGGLTVEFMNGVRVEIPIHRDFGFKRGFNV